MRNRQPLLPKNFQFNDLRKPVLEGQTRSEYWRRLQLRRMKELIEKHDKKILQALANDLGKPPTEGFFEVIALRQEIKLAEQQLTQWMKPRRVPVPVAFKPGDAMTRLEPLGCVLIIGPWNYPFSLTLQPLISALAAGNTAVIKPSEKAPNTSHLISKLISKHFPKEVVQVIEGDGEVATNLIEHPFDHIFFTGGKEIGQKVLSAASKNLTPVTLELGGQSPAIVLEDADLEVTAKRLIWGKGLNAGQTCIAPNHLLVQEQIKNPLLKAMKTALLNFYGSDPLSSSHLASIINDYHFERLNELLEQASRKGQILFGGDVDKEKCRISPTLIEIQGSNDPLMAEELFGPLMPVMSFANFDSALEEVRKQPRPLALYLFGGSKKDQKKLIDTTSSGGVCFNDVVMQAGIPDMPFGGVGPSGMGTYHGQAGFETFSHKKSILKRPFWLDLNFRYPPYKLDVGVLKKLLG